MVSEAAVEQVALSWLSSLGWQTAYGPRHCPRHAGRRTHRLHEIVLEEHLRDALLN